MKKDNGRTHDCNPPLPKLLNPYKNGKPFLLNNPDYYSLTSSEKFEARERLFKNAIKHAVQSSWETVVGTGLAVFGIGCAESSYYLRPLRSTTHQQQKLSPKILTKHNNGTARLKFVIQYGISQMIPSIMLHSQPCTAIADLVGLDRQSLYKECEMPSKYVLRRNFLFYLRGGIAGVFLFSQIISITHQVLDASKEHSQLIKRGRAAPFESSIVQSGTNAGVNSNWAGKVIRLCGSISDVSVLSMRNLGRDRFFPIFEDNTAFLVKQMVDEHSVSTADTDGSSISKAVPMVPVYWHVEDGTYGVTESWKGLHVPNSWLFDIKPKNEEERKSTSLGKEVPLAENDKAEKLLILEADTTPGNAESMAFFTQNIHDLDLDLNEVMEGFKQLTNVALKGPTNIAAGLTKENLRVLRVLLLDPNAQKTTGSGKKINAHLLAENLDIADIIIDSHAPILRCMERWLERESVDLYPRWYYVARSPWRYVGLQKRKPVILETKHTEWFEEIRKELRLLGYDAIGLHEAVSQYNIEDIAKIPTFVYERTTPDTIQCIRSYRKFLTRIAADAGKTLQPANGKFCALCPNHDFLNTLRHHHNFPFICSSQIYDHLFSCVRLWAQEGMSHEEIKSCLESDGLDRTLGPIYDVILHHKVEHIDQPDVLKLQERNNTRNEAKALSFHM